MGICGDLWKSVGIYGNPSDILQASPADLWINHLLKVRFHLYRLLFFYFKLIAKELLLFWFNGSIKIFFYIKNFGSPST